MVINEVGKKNINSLGKTMPNYNYETVVKPFLDECWKNKLNYELLRKYEKILTPLNVYQNTKEGLSCPHCLLFGPKYQPGKDNGGVFILVKKLLAAVATKLVGLTPLLKGITQIRVAEKN